MPKSAKANPAAKVVKPPPVTVNRGAESVRPKRAAQSASATPKPPAAAVKSKRANPSGISGGGISGIGSGGLRHLPSSHSEPREHQPPPSRPENEAAMSSTTRPTGRRPVPSPIQWTLLTTQTRHKNQSGCRTVVLPGGQAVLETPPTSDQQTVGAQSRHSSAQPSGDEAATSSTSSHRHRAEPSGGRAPVIPSTAGPPEPPEGQTFEPYEYEPYKLMPWFFGTSRTSCTSVTLMWTPSALKNIMLWKRTGAQDRSGDCMHVTEIGHSHCITTGEETRDRYFGVTLHHLHTTRSLTSSLQTEHWQY